MPRNTNDKCCLCIGMGGWLSYMWWGGDPDEKHSVSGLSKRDIHHVQRSWAVAYADSVGTGTELLKRFFRTYPETKNFFRMIKNLPEDKYLENAQFKAHVINLMTSLNLAISNLHQPDIVIAMMQKLGESHNRRKIKEQHFNELKEVIVKMFIEVLHLDDNTLGSWGRVVEFWYKHIYQQLDPVSPEQR